MSSTWKVSGEFEASWNYVRLCEKPGGGEERGRKMDLVGLPPGADNQQTHPPGSPRGGCSAQALWSARLIPTLLLALPLPSPKEAVPLALETEVRVLGGFALRKSNLNPETDEILLPN